MRPFEADEVPNIRWVSGAGSFSKIIDPSQLILRWNETGDTAYVYLEEPFKLGPHNWSLNSVQSSQPSSASFRDVSGNLLAPILDQRIFITHPESDALPADSALERAPAVDTIFLLKDKVISDSEVILGIDLAHFYTTVSLPEFTWNTVHQARLLTPNEEVLALTSPLFAESNALHIDGLLSSFGSQFLPFSDGTYQIELDTFRDGDYSLSLELSGDRYPPRAQLLQECESLHIPASRPFLLRLDGGASDDVDRSELIVAEGSFPRIERGPVVHNLVYRSIYEEGATQFEIPAHTLAPNRDYFAVIRHYRFIDEDLSYAGVLARSGLVTTTEFKLSTRLPSLACPQAITENLFVSRLNGSDGPLRAIRQGEHLMPIARLLTQSEPGVIEFGLGSTIELHANSLAQLDASGSLGGNIILQLDAGGATIAMDSRDADVFGLEVKTDGGTLISETGRSVILHERDSKVTSITVVEGESKVYRTESPNEHETIAAGNGIQFRPTVAPESPTDLPSLRISVALDGGMLLSWDKAYRDWQVYSRSNLSGEAEWTRHEESVVENDAGFVTRVVGEGEYRYFQLLPAGLAYIRVVPVKGRVRAA